MPEYTYILSAEDMAWIRRQVGDVNTPPAFPDVDLRDIYNRARGNLDAAVLACFDELIGSAWRFADYAQNQSEEKKSQVFNNLLKARPIWEGKVSSARQSTRILPLYSYPPRRKAHPDDASD